MVYHVYCDESRQSKDRFMVLGGIIIPSTSVEQFNATMRKFRDEERMFAERKWSKVSNHKISEYKRFAEYFFALNNNDKLHFHAMIVDNHQVDHKKFNKGDKELGFYKFYYQLLLHCFGAKYYRKPEDRFIIHLDYRNTHYKLGTLKQVLNNGIKKKLKIAEEPFVSIEPRDSKKSELIAGTRQSKIELARYIAAEAGLRDLKQNSPYGRRRFTVWNFKLQK